MSSEPGSTDSRGESQPRITGGRDSDSSAARQVVHHEDAPPIGVGGSGSRPRQGFIHDDRWIQADAFAFEELDAGAGARSSVPAVDPLGLALAEAEAVRERA